MGTRTRDDGRETRRDVRRLDIGEAASPYRARVSRLASTPCAPHTTLTPHFPLETGGGMGYTCFHLARKGRASRFQDGEQVRFVKEMTSNELHFAIAGDNHR